MYWEVEQVSNITEKALKNMQAMMRQAEINSADNTDEQALEVQALYPEWESFENGHTFTVGNRVNYQEVLYLKHNALNNQRQVLRKIICMP